ncbi:MAG: hypothetical protein U0V70_21080 [Terriglobia bacterium]
MKSPPDPALQGLLEKAGLYAFNYREKCRELVAEERMVQKEYGKNANVKRQRNFMSDYFIVTLSQTPLRTVEFRDILSIDGKDLPRKSNKLVELFKTQSPDALKEVERITKESTKHNLGRERYTNMVNFALNFLLPENQNQIAYSFQNPGKDSLDTTAVVIHFCEFGNRTALSADTPTGRHPIYSSGYIWLTLPEVEVLRVDFSFKSDNEQYPISGRYISEYTRGTDNLMLPKRFEERFYDFKEPELMTFESEALYSNYRKFSTDVKILPSE